MGCLIEDMQQELATQGVKALLDKLAVGEVKQTKPKTGILTQITHFKAT